MASLKKIIAPILFCLPLFIAAQDESIQWSSKRLTWEDYLAKPLEEDEAAAVTSTGIGIEYLVSNNRLSYKITCLFSKNRSWGRYRSAYILSHEQGHFDITEIFARKLAKAINDYEFNPRAFRSDLSGIYKKIMKEKEDYQELYDHQTDFSRDRAMQAYWLQKIQDDLNELGDWANYGT
jgi:predicted secreted Zn-dependent protease